jgi:hypothetical protein
MKYLLFAGVILALFSCQKESTHNLISDLGFDLSRVTLGNTVTTPAKSFKTLEEAREYIAAIKPRGKIITGTYDPATDTRLRTGITFRKPDTPPREDIPDAPVKVAASLNDWHLWTGYNVAFTWDVGIDGEISGFSDFNSGLIGFTLGTSWTHQSGYANEKDGIISFTIYGIQNYNIIVEGIGTLWSQTVTISGTYNTKTKQYTMTEQ